MPDGIKQTFDRLGIPEAERKFLAGVTAQYESGKPYITLSVQTSRRKVLSSSIWTQGFASTKTSCANTLERSFHRADNKFAALNSAVWSGGSFVWIPKGVKVEIPLQAYFRINAEKCGQFERTLIIAEPGSFVHYIEGCTAPTGTDSLHSAVVELIAKPGAHIRYTTIQNWSKNVYNLVTKRAVAHADAKVEWVDGNLGSKLTMKYPSIYLVGPRAHGEVLSIAFAGEDQHQDAGAKMVHAAPDTTSIITSKSISKNGGRTSSSRTDKGLSGGEKFEVVSQVRCTFAR